ncbi:MAG: phosphotransferase [Gemmataceae bacterium]
MIRWPSVDPKLPLAYWPQGLGEARPIPASGLSGACVWQVGEAFALRATPAAQASLAEMKQRHRWMRMARSVGLEFVPHLVPLSDGTTVFSLAGWLWELQQWMPGQVDSDQPPQPHRVARACQALARLHLVWQREQRPSATAPAIERRLAEWPDSELQRWQGRSWQLHPCLVDIHRAHVFFEAEQVSGIIDYGTLQWDIPHADLARLLGSWAEDDETLWQAGLQAYAQVAPLPEVTLIRCLDRVGTLVAVQRWQRWLAGGGPASPIAYKRWQDLQRRVSQWKEPVIVTKTAGCTTILEKDDQASRTS